MDQGTGQIIAASILVLGPMVATFVQGRLAARALKKAAHELKTDTANQVGTVVSEMVAVKEQSQATHNLVNSGLAKLLDAKDQLIDAARRQGNVEGEQRAKAERAEADLVGKQKKRE